MERLGRVRPLESCVSDAANEMAYMPVHSRVYWVTGTAVCGEGAGELFECLEVPVSV